MNEKPTLLNGYNKNANDHKIKVSKEAFEALKKMKGIVEAGQIGNENETIEKSNRVFDVVTKDGEEFKGVYFIQYNEDVACGTTNKKIGSVIKYVRCFNIEGESIKLNAMNITVTRWYDPETGEEFDFSELHQGNASSAFTYNYPLARKVVTIP